MRIPRAILPSVACVLLGLALGVCLSERYTVTVISFTGGVENRPVSCAIKLDRFTGRTWLAQVGAEAALDRFSGSSWQPMSSR